MNTVPIPFENLEACSSVRVEGAGSKEIQAAVDKSQFESQMECQENVVFLSLASILDSKKVYYTVLDKDKVLESPQRRVISYPKTHSGNKTLKSLIFIIGKYTLVFDIVDILAKVIDVNKDKLQLGDINLYQFRVSKEGGNMAEGEGRGGQRSEVVS